MRSSRDPMLGPRGIAKTHATNQPGQDPTDPTADLVELPLCPVSGSVPGALDYEIWSQEFESLRARQPSC
jgi:hypothetical protein